jgi:hypothetical protein
VLVYGYYVFPKPSVQGFPTSADPADRNRRYLVQPPTVPSLARLRDYQRPPRGGRGRCRRACYRTPSGAAAAAPPAGAHQAPLHSETCGCHDNRICVSGHKTHACKWPSEGATGAEAHDDRQARCMGAVPSGDYFACITSNDLEGLFKYIIVSTCTFKVVSGIIEYV